MKHHLPDRAHPGYPGHGLVQRRTHDIIHYSDQRRQYIAAIGVAVDPASTVHHLQKGERSSRISPRRHIMRSALSSVTFRVFSGVAVV